MAYGQKPSEGTVYPVSQFREMVDDESLIDDDGFGHPVKDGLVDTDVIVSPSAVEDLPEDATHVEWFNR